MGSSIPIKNIQEINCIKDLYRQKNQISELLMFTLAINTGIDLINLLNLRVKDIKNKKYLCIEKNKSIPLNEEILKLIAIYSQMQTALRDIGQQFFILSKILSQN